jgi:hypothetical protein
MTKIVNVEAYKPSEERYVNLECVVGMEAHGISGWMIVAADGEPVTYLEASDWFEEQGIEPVTFDQVDAAARKQLLGER